jgi:hypothetical protein
MLPGLKIYSMFLLPYCRYGRFGPVPYRQGVKFQLFGTATARLVPYSPVKTTAVSVYGSLQAYPIPVVQFMICISSLVPEDPIRICFKLIYIDSDEQVK